MIGETISHYRVIEKLGGGGMGVVYKAEDTRLHRYVALKFLPEDVDDVREVMREWQARKQSDALFGDIRYALAFIGSDPTAKADAQKELAAKHDHLHYAMAADTEGYFGRVGRSRELMKQSLQAAMQTDDKESGAIWQAVAAQREAVFGYTAEARRGAAEAAKLAPGSRAMESETALAFALAGETARAESMAQDLQKRFPLDTQMQSAWLPAIQAQVALDRGKPDQALSLLRVAQSPIELGTADFITNISCVYPAYVRGEAYLAAGQGAAAAGEFQKVIDHSGVVWNCWTGAMAHLGMARAYALEAKDSGAADHDAARARAVTAYESFLTLWKEADEDVPVLKQARAELAKLR